MNIQQELDWVCAQVEKNIQIFGENFPSACTLEGKYRIKPNDDWTNGFWTGILWICYEYSKKDIFKQLAIKNGESFKKRLDDRFVVEHHDIGFLYTPSLVAQYKITNDKSCYEYSLKAADILLERYQKKGKFIQAWGQLDAQDEYRFIVDSLINLPLLYWAFAMTNNSKYKEVADAHYQTVIKYGIRQDNTTHHTYYFDKTTGAPLGGKTAQGFSDKSCWARGQAWVILGSVLNNRFTPNSDNLTIFERVYQKYKSCLPQDKVPYWDLIFNEQSNQYHDSSAAAITLCALLERKNQLQDTEYNNDIKQTMTSLITKYSARLNPKTQGLLEHGVYAYSAHKGINEANLWGDYFYVEALYRLYTNNEWKGYW
ncbi:MAG: glycoside hydrolase family 88 protein [Mycoplasmatales bacterium]